MKYILYIFLALILLSCSQNAENKSEDKKIGILLVSHGSRSAAWREMLSAVEDSVRTEVLENKDISGLKSAFMEYTEPSIATRLKEFDKEGFTDVIIIPLFLTVSGHSFDDIPTIAGLKSSQADIEHLKQERIEVYKAKANITITELLDYPKFLGLNLAERVKKLSKNPKDEGCILVAYGDEEYNKEWTALLENMYGVIEKETGINKFDLSWCGHIVSYDPEPTSNAIRNVLSEKKTALVMPVLVAFDEMFQGQVIGDAIDNVKMRDRILYKPDAILPDKNFEKWVINAANKYTAQLISNRTASN